MNRKNIIIGIVLAALLGGGGYEVQQNLGGKDVAVKLENPEHIVWEKPSTDAQWAEDVKAESFHIKSTGKLEEMLMTHLEKHNRMIQTNIEFYECPECVKYKIKVDHPEFTEKEIQTDFNEQLIHYEVELESITRSIERMQNEVRLRNEGFVAVEGEKNSDIRFGSAVPPERIRHIND